MNRRQKLFIAAVVLIELILFGALIYRLYLGYELVSGCWWLLLLIAMFFGIGRAFVCPPAFPQQLIDAFGPNVGSAFSGFGRRSARKEFYNAVRPLYNDKYEKCLRKLKKVERRCKEPADYAAVYLIMAVCHDRLFDSYNTAVSYRKALSRVHDIPGAHANLSATLVELGLYDEALESIDTAIYYLECAPNREDKTRDAYFYGNKATLLVKLRRFEEALACAERSYELDNTHPHAIQALSAAHFHLGNLEESKRYQKLGADLGLPEHYLHPSAIVLVNTDQ